MITKNSGTMIYAASIEDFAFGLQRLRALQTLDLKIKVFDYAPYLKKTKLQRVRDKFGRVFSGVKNNFAEQLKSDLVRAINAHRPDYVWLEKPVFIKHETISQIREIVPSAKLICMQDDDPFISDASKSQWGDFITMIPKFDFHLVPKKVNIKEFKDAGAKNTILYQNGFCEEEVRLTREMRGANPEDAGFTYVGSAMNATRIRFIEKLMEEHRVPMRVYGHWSRTRIRYSRYNSFRGYITQAEYRNITSRSSMSLVIPNDENRDEYTGRTYYIPASGVFLLAKRTPTHQELFEEGLEAEFFDTAEECADKYRYYSRNESARRKIAEQGYRRSIRSGYSLREALSRVWTEIEQTVN